jgi:hypothetical protein
MTSVGARCCFRMGRLRQVTVFNRRDIRLGFNQPKHWCSIRQKAGMTALYTVHSCPRNKDIIQSKRSNGSMGSSALREAS